MKMVAFGTAPARRAITPPAEQPPREASAVPQIWYAHVIARDQSGLATKLGLPLETAGARIPLYVNRDRACWVHSSGVVQSPDRDPELLALLRPGVRIVACTTRNGITALAATCAPAPAAPQKRAAEPVRTRSSGRHEVDPNEAHQRSLRAAAAGSDPVFHPEAPRGYATLIITRRRPTTEQAGASARSCAIPCPNFPVMLAR